MTLNPLDDTERLRLFTPAAGTWRVVDPGVAANELERARGSIRRLEAQLGWCPADDTEWERRLAPYVKSSGGLTPKRSRVEVPELLRILAVGGNSARVMAATLPLWIAANRTRTALSSLVGLNGRLIACETKLVHTGRASTSRPNLHGLSGTKPEHRPTKSLVGPAGVDRQFVLALDVSGCDFLSAAALSEDERLISDLASGADLPQRVADLTGMTRMAAKGVLYGSLYGRSAPSIGRALDVSDDEAKTLVDKLYNTYPVLRAWIERRVADAKLSVPSVTLSGRQIPPVLYDIGSTQAGQPRWRAGLNHPIQGTSADLVANLLAQAEDAHKLCELSVHDSGVWQFSTLPELRAVAPVLVDAMTTPPAGWPAGLPIRVSGEWGLGSLLTKNAL